MCAPMIAPVLGSLGSVGAALQTVGTVVGIGSAIYSGVQGYQAAKANVRAIEEQKHAEAKMTAIEDARTRRRFNSEIRRQTAELAARGIQLDSATAVVLGQEAAKEMSFASQGVRAKGNARQIELTSAQRAMRAQGKASLLKGGLGAVTSFVNNAPQIWPELNR